MLRWFCLWGTNPLSRAATEGVLCLRESPQNPMKKYTQIA